MKILNNSILRKHSPPLWKSLLLSKTNTKFIKHYYFLLVAITFTFNSFGQLNKTNWLVGGSGSFYNYNGTYSSSSNNATTKVTDIDIKTSIGYFLIDKLSVGLRPSFSYSRGKVYQSGVQSGLISSNTLFLIGPFARYYFLEKEKQFNLLADISYLVGTNTSPLPPKTKGSLNEFSVSGGAEIFFNSSVGFEFLVGYKKKYSDIKGSTGYVDNKSGFQIGIGFQIHLIK